MNTFTITLAPEPSEVPPIIRLRRFLKDAKRRHGLKAIDVQMVDTPTPLDVERWLGEGGADHPTIGTPAQAMRPRASNASQRASGACENGQKYGNEAGEIYNEAVGEWEQRMLAGMALFASDPERVLSGPVSGGSISVDGTDRVAFQDQLVNAERGHNQQPDYSRSNLRLPRLKNPREAQPSPEEPKPQIATTVSIANPSIVTPGPQTNREQPRQNGTRTDAQEGGRP